MRNWDADFRRLRRLIGVISEICGLFPLFGVFYLLRRHAEFIQNIFGR